MFQKATKTEIKLRLGICGPSGSGKTYSALAIAAQLGQKIAVVDTEHGSAKRYADIFNFDVLELESYHPDRAILALRSAEQNGYDVVIIDSLSHFWMGREGELELVDKAAKRSPSGNTWTAWKEVTPLHNALIEALIASKCHVIVTLRSKTEWVLEENDKGKKIPRKVGMAPVMRDGIEFEFDVFAEMTASNEFVVTKTRCPELNECIFRKPGADVANILKVWMTGSPVEAVVATPSVKPEGDLPQADSLKEQFQLALTDDRSRGLIVPAHGSNSDVPFREVLEKVLKAWDKISTHKKESVLAFWNEKKEGVCN
jgi:hypothetical protein